MNLKEGGNRMTCLCGGELQFVILGEMRLYHKLENSKVVKPPCDIDVFRYIDGYLKCTECRRSFCDLENEDGTVARGEERFVLIESRGGGATDE